MNPDKRRASNALLRLIEAVQSLPLDDRMHFAQQLETLADRAEHIASQYEREAEAADEQSNKAVA